MKTHFNPAFSVVVLWTMTLSMFLLNLMCAPVGYAADASEDDGPPPKRGLHAAFDTDLAPALGAYMLLDNHSSVVPTYRNGHQVDIAVHELSTGPRDSIIVMIHGVFSWSGTWHSTVPDLVKRHDVWLIDLPGCGWSDKPHPRKLAPDGYSPAALADRVMQAIEARLAARTVQGSVPRVWLVGHSLGSTILLRAAMLPELRRRHARTLEAVAGLVLLCPCDTGLPSVPPAFEPLLNIKGWQVTAADLLGVLRKEIQATVASSYQNPKRATVEEAEFLIAVLRRPACRRALIAMLRQAVPFDERSSRPLWSEAESCAEHYGDIQKPCLLVWGERDEILPEATGHKLKDKIPHARLVEIEGCGHSIPRENPQLVKQIIEAFIAETTLAGSPQTATDRQEPIAKVAAATVAAAVQISSALTGFSSGLIEPY